MIELDRHIEILLLSNDCVIVPDLGGFMTHHVNARYDNGDGMFLPPLRTLGFNPQLKMNDSLLAQSYVEAYDISYPEAVRRIEAEVSELKQHLETEGYYELNDIGVLAVNEEGHYEFSPCEAGILTPDLYGLSTFEMPRLSDKKAKAADAASHHFIKSNDGEHTITLKTSWIRNAVAVAAAIVAFFLITTPVSNSNTNMRQSSSIIPIAMSEQPKAHPADSIESVAIEELLSEDTLSAETVSAEEEDVTSEVVTTEKEQAEKVEVEAPQKTYCIVLASQVTKPNAEEYTQKLCKQGYDKARVYINNNMVRVIYGTYASEADAYGELRTLRSESTEFSDAWVLKLK